MTGLLKRLEGSRLGLAGLAVGAVLFLAVNLFADVALRGHQLDLTEGRLYTVSDGTKRTLAAIDEPISLRLYFSRNLAEAAPRYAAHYARVRELLQRYAGLAGGRVSLQLLDPEPFSDAEDRAVADGIQGVPVTAAGDLGYFGLAAANTTDGRATIPFFNLEREPFLEYDLTKLLYTLVKPNLPKLGLIGSAALASAPTGLSANAGEPLILGQLNDFFEIERLDGDLAAVPEGIDVLMVIAPQQLGEDALKAIDAFVRGGGRAMVFLDPLVESAQGAPPPEAEAGALATQILAGWGVRMVPDKVAGDLDAARRVSTGARGAVLGDYVAWLTLGTQGFDREDPIFANVERLNLATAGILEPIEGAKTSFTPVLTTGPRSMAIDLADVRFMPDVARLLRAFVPSGKPLTLAARLTGGPAPAPAAERTGAEPSAAGEPAKPIDVIVIADIDMLYDRFWVSAGEFFGEQVLVPSANNADFIANALENLSGSEALIGLRGRGTSYRPFTLIEAFRRDAELQYRAKEEQLQARLSELQGKLKSLNRGGERGSGEFLLTADDKAAIDRFRGEILTVRRELRNVQHALRSDIEGLESTIKAANIAVVPAFVCLVAVVVAALRRARRQRGRQPGGIS
ncbi:conserved hypothetical protein [uncultured Defluviicoccus sp.]|uniref:Uncharacterized protein n=1 Tax=metagenome TaxID=256318 RepID=A0A380TEW9_9ZZZZ|nr:conserved hypothetical protein [uncultured Defluviicoccus sp.]